MIKVPKRVACLINLIVTKFSEPTFQDGEGIESDYKTPIFGFKSDILAIYRYVKFAIFLVESKTHVKIYALD